jgi:hypothetical protein
MSKTIEMQTLLEELIEESEQWIATWLDEEWIASDWADGMDLLYESRIDEEGQKFEFVGNEYDAHIIRHTRTGRKYKVWVIVEEMTA